jgi:hypothetical protein
MIIRREKADEFIRENGSIRSLLLNSGRIDANNVQYFTDKDTILKMHSYLEKFLVLNGLNKVDVYAKQKGYIIELAGILLLCSHKDIFTVYGKNIMGEKMHAVGNIKENLIKMGILFGDRSYQNFFNIIRQRLRNIGSIIILDYNLEHNTILMNDGKWFYTLPLNDMVIKFKQHLLLPKDISADFIRYINSNKTNNVDREDAIDLWDHYRDVLKEVKHFKSR